MKSHPARFLLPPLLLAAACTANPASAQEAPTIQGTWTGRIGNSAVNACFTPYSGHYYYQRYLNGIALSSEDGSWKEPDAQWKISRVSDTELDGVWLGNGKRLTIHLTRRAPLQQDGECGDAYYAPIVDAVKYQYSDTKVGALPVRIVKSPLGQAFELKGESAAIRHINDFARRWLGTQAINAFSCKVGGGEEWQSDLTANKVIGNYLLVAENEPDNFCGGAHGNSYHANHLFDLRTGQPVNTFTWLANGKASLEEKHPLRKLLEKLNPRDDCDDDSYEISAPFPAAAGFRFPTSYIHANRACNDEIEVSYARLAPYLSNEGKAFVKSLKR